MGALRLPPPQREFPVASSVQLGLHVGRFVVLSFACESRERHRRRERIPPTVAGRAEADKRAGLIAARVTFDEARAAFFGGFVLFRVCETGSPYFRCKSDSASEQRAVLTKHRGFLLFCFLVVFLVGRSDVFDPLPDVLASPVAVGRLDIYEGRIVWFNLADPPYNL